jgi:hypothetical protein
MPNFAVLDNTEIVNIIVANSKAEAEELTQKECVEFTYGEVEIGGHHFGSTHIGGRYLNNTFIIPQPFDGWTLNEDLAIWEPPIPKPEFDESDPKLYFWDKETNNWQGVAIVELPE